LENSIDGKIAQERKVGPGACIGSKQPQRALNGSVTKLEGRDVLDLRVGELRTEKRGRAEKLDWKLGPKGHLVTTKGPRGRLPRPVEKLQRALGEALLSFKLS